MKGGLFQCCMFALCYDSIHEWFMNNVHECYSQTFTRTGQSVNNLIHEHIHQHGVLCAVMPCCLDDQCNWPLDQMRKPEINCVLNSFNCCIVSDNG